MKKYTHDDDDDDVLVVVIMRYVKKILEDYQDTD